MLKKIKEYNDNPNVNDFLPSFITSDNSSVYIHVNGVRFRLTQNIPCIKHYEITSSGVNNPSITRKIIRPKTEDDEVILSLS